MNLSAEQFHKAGSLSHLTRFLVFRSKESRNYLCVCAAPDAKAALKTARRIFALTRTAHAIPERRSA